MHVGRLSNVRHYTETINTLRVGVATCTRSRRCASRPCSTARRAGRGEMLVGIGVVTAISAVPVLDRRLRRRVGGRVYDPFRVTQLDADCVALMPSALSRYT